MTDLTESSRRIAAPAARAYATLADYAQHRRILPKPPFSGLDIVAGGVGAGTVLDVHLSVLGRRQTMRMTVTEPEPGRVLEERATDGTVTTFTVDADDAGCVVTIQTRWPDHRFLRNWMVRRTYRQELDALAKLLA